MKHINKKLNSQGFLQHLAPFAIVVILAIAGTAYYVASHAATASSNIVAQNSGQCLSVNGSSNREGAAIVQWKCSSSATNELWKLASTSTAGYYNVVVQNSGQCLSVNGASTTEGAAIVQWKCSSSATNELWKLASTSTSGYYNIVAENSGQCLNVGGDSTSEGGSIIQWACVSGAKNESWSGTALTATSSTSAPTITLTASPISVSPGGSSTLTWSSANATSCAAASPASWTTSTATSGTQSVSPTATTSYTITCTGGGGSTTSSAAIVTVSSGNLAACTNSGATGAGSPSKVINVAAPSGDMTTTIQNDLNSASGGGEVVLQAGTYTISSSLTVPSGVLFTGAGESSTTIMASSTTSVNPMITTSNNSNITVQNMTVDQNGDSAGASQNLSYYMVETLGTNTIFQNIATRDPSTYSIVASGAKDFCFRNNNVLQDPAENGKYDQLDGIHVLNSSNGDVLDNYVDNSYDGATDGDDALVVHAYGGPVSNIRFQGNIAQGGQNGVGFAVWDYNNNITNITFTDNELWGEAGVYHGNGSDGDTGNFTNSSITNNILHNNVYNVGIDLGGNSLTVTGNMLCSSGTVDITGSSNTVSNNTTYTGCTDAPSTTTPPPITP